ncbi:MAG: hypothetical protein EYX74_03375 [Desulfobulbaceae bacterium]|nr:MAG: hypothetical protein EYX74_03375 [Desulfobulbaceae bacterium]
MKNNDPAAVVRFDKKRKGKKLSNREWQSQTDPDSRIARMKDGTTRLAYKSEHAVDLATGAMLGIKMYPANQGDTASVDDTLTAAEDNLAILGNEPPELLCVVADRGYHQADLIRNIDTDKGLTTYIPERRSEQRRRWHGDEEACLRISRQSPTHPRQRRQAAGASPLRSGGTKFRHVQTQRQPWQTDPART